MCCGVAACDAAPHHVAPYIVTVGRALGPGGLEGHVPAPQRHCPGCAPCPWSPQGAPLCSRAAPDRRRPSGTSGPGDLQPASRGREGSPRAWAAALGLPPGCGLPGRAAGSGRLCRHTPLWPLSRYSGGWTVTLLPLLGPQVQAVYLAGAGRAESCGAPPPGQGPREEQAPGALRPALPFPWTSYCDLLAVTPPAPALSALGPEGSVPWPTLGPGPQDPSLSRPGPGGGA